MRVARIAASLTYCGHEAIPPKASFPLFWIFNEADGMSPAGGNRSLHTAAARNLVALTRAAAWMVWLRWARAARPGRPVSSHDDRDDSPR